MGAGRIQLSAIGPQDLHLTAHPHITFFKTVYKRHTNFSKKYEDFILEESKNRFWY